jgi:ribosomal protein S5
MYRINSILEKLYKDEMKNKLHKKFHCTPHQNCWLIKSGRMRCQGMWHAGERTQMQTVTVVGESEGKGHVENEGRVCPSTWFLPETTLLNVYYI